MKVIIDPYDDILYKSFYIYGLETVLGRKNVLYDAKSFSSLSDESRNTKSMRFIVDGGNGKRRFMISCNDSYQIIPELYEWCDVYGSVNANFSKTPPEYHKKLVSLCPSFAIKCWSGELAMLHAVKDIFTKQCSLKKHFGKYKRLLQRSELENYQAATPNQDYLFLCSTLWTNDEWNKNDETVNLARARFIRAARSIGGGQFEGGFVPSDSSSNELFRDCLCQRYGTREWIQNTQKSLCVFNTPAYWQCHGWKLGEYMALGKAIITTPLSNDLPYPLVHGKQIHIVENDQEAMRNAIVYIRTHTDYRQKLEKNVATYWHQYGAPQASLKLLGVI